MIKRKCHIFLILLDILKLSYLVIVSMNSRAILGISLAAFSMFVVGYTASRVLLTQSTSENTIIESTVTPHQASMWNDLGQ